MKTKFKDVAHLYLGVEVVNTIGKHMGKIVSASIDGTATINPLDEFKPRVIILNSLKPILRPLSDLTTEESAYLSGKGFCISSKGYLLDEAVRKQQFTIQEIAFVINYLRSRSIDCDNLIESGEAIDKTKHNETGKSSL